MRRVAGLICLVVLLGTIPCAKAGGQDTLRRVVERYDPIDYAAVQRNLDAASKESLLSRIAKHRRSPYIYSSPNLKIKGELGLGYLPTTELLFMAGASAYYPSSKSHPEQSASYVAVNGGISTTEFYTVKIMGENRLSQGVNRLYYNFSLSSLPIKFWGLGYEAAERNGYSRYTRRYRSANFRYMRQVSEHFSAGATLDLRYGEGRSFEDLALKYLSEAGVTHYSAFTTGVGIVGEYDSRDNTTATTDGLYISLLAEYRPETLGDVGEELWHITATLDFYEQLWEGGVVALDLYGDFWSSATPWLFWSSIGGESRLRGYYYGRYSDSKMASAQIELRQNIYKVIGCVAWVGGAYLFPSHKLFDTSELLPNGGVGLRIATGVNSSLRIDYGFGRHSNGIVFGINEAF